MDTQSVKYMVAYTDGSSIDKTEFHEASSGSGIHGYGYNTTIQEQALAIYKQKKLPEIKINYASVAELPEVIGDDGYHNIPKSQQTVKEISINDLDLVLFECHHPILGGTSQVGELQAFIDLMEAPIAASVEYIIYTDSNYLKQGIQEWMEGWKSKGWTKSGGGPIGNKDLWVRIYELVQELKAKKVKLTLHKIKGHSGRFGNDEADRMAGQASSLAANLQENEQLSPVDFAPRWEVGPYRCEEDSKDIVVDKALKGKDTKSASKSKKPKKVKDEEKFIPILLRQKYLYLVGGEDLPQVELEGESLYRYYGGDHAKLKDDRLLLGKAHPDAMQYVTFVKDKVEILDELINETHERTWDGVPLMYRSNLVYLLNGTFMNQEKFNRRFLDDCSMDDLIYNRDYNELYFDDKNWLSVAVRPPMLSFRAMDLADKLTHWYKDFVELKRESNHMYGIKDVTGMFYDANGKPTSFYRTIDRSIKLKARVPGTDKELEIILPRNIALPDRTYLNRLAKHNLKMYLVARKETKNAFRFFVILESDLGRQLIISYYSSLRIHG